MVAITAALVGSSSPQAVQVAVSGLAAGDAYQVVGQWSGGSWPVRGGNGVSDGSLLVLADVAAPIRVPVSYQVTVGTAVVTSPVVTVAYPDRYVLTSVDGRLTAPFVAMDNALPRTHALRGVSFDIPGRRDPVVIYDTPAASSSEIVAKTNPAETRALDALLDLGGLALLRTDGAVRDLPATSYVLITSATDQLRDGSDDRVWTLGYRVMGDPEPDVVVTASTLDDLAASYAGLTWADFAAEWAGQTWDDVATYDWASRA